MLGETLSHYRVIRSIGGGGMGEVYEAEDLRLGRHVALKVVSATYKQSPSAYRRFEREARAASSLNHPNICTIYDLLEHQGQPVIVMELLEGRSLAQVMGDGRIDERRFLRVAQQVADGLEAAHRAGVIHRDITPANIFVTAQDDVKILDFGLAKLGAGADSDEHSQSETHAPAGSGLTGAGQLVGTVAYMSPEQVRGETLDARTDLFSFGAVLYEMATGRRAFEGRTTPMVCDAILHASPAPLHRTNSRVPSGLQPIVEKALEKDRDLRYQSAADLKADLMRLGRDVAPTPPQRRRAVRWGAVLTAGILLGAALVYGLWQLGGPADPAIDAAPRVLTSGPGVETDPAISPDGKTIAYTSDESGSRDIWLVDVTGGRPQRFTSEPSHEEHPSWFPDGAALAFQSDRDGMPGVYRAPRAGGALAALVVQDARTPAVSPDGTRIAFTRRRSEGFLRVAVVTVADPSRVTFLTGSKDGAWDHRQPAWSPDGRSISYEAMDGIWVVEADGRGTPRRVNPEEVTASNPTWSADGAHVYYSALRNGQYALWRQAVAGGSASRVTMGGGTERMPHAAPGGGALAFSTESVIRHLRFVDLRTREEVRWETGSGDEYYPALAPDKSAVFFVSNRFGGAGIWRQAMLGGQPAGDGVQLSRQPGRFSFLDVSRDGRLLLYTYMRGDDREIWMVPTSAGRGEPIRVSAPGVRAIHPAWSPDGGAVAYAVEDSGEQQVWIQRVKDGRPDGRAEQVTTTPGYKRWPAWIDTNLLAYVAVAPSGLAEVVISDLKRRSAPRWLTSGADACRVRYVKPLGLLLVSGLWGVGADSMEIRGFDLEGRPQPFVPMSVGPDILSAFFDLSADGQTVVFTRGEATGDIWILEAQGTRRY